MRKYKAIVEYDGTDFCGFQLQARDRTVQGEIESALCDLAEQRIPVLGAGRTDSGVHAVGQVIAFSLSWMHSPEALLRAVNARLGRDVALLKVEPVEGDFHPRHDAKRRHYRYRILNRAVRSPLERRYDLYLRKPLDVQAMSQAASSLVGEHDFAAFGRPPQGTNSVRRMFRADWQRTGDILIFDIEANAFLYRMVRSIVGTLLLVGLGHISVQRFAEVLAGGDRQGAGPTVLPCGLCLMAVHYNV